ncbi:H/ACA ribonucleoprotein complex subunit GAR1 [Candidatus Methanomassiliicoccus intestinalis]|nr:Gar1/Naf1 family protein [Candidatus Methanomassiliicoccus intestinalis]
MLSAGMRMKFLGTVSKINYDGKLIVRGSFAPNPRDRIVDNRNKPVGQVGRVFGPVDSPYILVRPNGKGGMLSLIGKQVYIEEVTYNAKGKRRDRRN